MGKNKYVLVLGSKPNAVLPKIKPLKIYTANAAASLASFYMNDTNGTDLTAVVGSGEIQKEHVKKNVIESKPTTVIARRNKCNVKELLGMDLPNSKLYNFSSREQWTFQKKILGWKILIAELHYAKNITKKIQRLSRHLFNKNSLGLSTGAFAILIAAIENPEYKIIISGIGLKPGGHFYKVNNDKGFTNRALVDQYMVPRFPKHIKQRLYTTDKIMSKIAGVKYWEGEAL